MDELDWVCRPSYTDSHLCTTTATISGHRSPHQTPQTCKVKITNENPALESAVHVHLTRTPFHSEPRRKQEVKGQSIYARLLYSLLPTMGSQPAPPARLWVQKDRQFEGARSSV